MSSLENCLISTYLLLFSTRGQMEKNWGDTPSATLMILHYQKHNKTPVWAHNHDLFDEHE